MVLSSESPWKQHSMHNKNVIAKINKTLANILAIILKFILANQMLTIGLFK